MLARLKEEINAFCNWPEPNIAMKGKLEVHAVTPLFPGPEGIAFDRKHLSLRPVWGFQIIRLNGQWKWDLAIREQHETSLDWQPLDVCNWDYGEVNYNKQNVDNSSLTISLLPYPFGSAIFSTMQKGKSRDYCACIQFRDGFATDQKMSSDMEGKHGDYRLLKGLHCMGKRNSFFVISISLSPFWSRFLMPMPKRLSG